MPKDGMIIGLITGQNGMQTSFKEFKSMSKSIVDKVPESALYVGLHNPCSWLGGDLFRVMKESNGKETPTVARTRQFMEAIVGQLHDINPKLLWMHISHSEGGLIAHNAIDKMNPDKKALLKEHLISLSLGPKRILLQGRPFLLLQTSFQIKIILQNGLPNLSLKIQTMI